MEIVLREKGALLCSFVGIGRPCRKWAQQMLSEGRHRVARMRMQKCLHDKERLQTLFANQHRYCALLRRRPFLTVWASMAIAEEFGSRIYANATDFMQM